MHLNRTAGRAVAGLSLAAALGLSAVQGAAASAPGGNHPTPNAAARHSVRAGGAGAGWHADGLSLNAAQDRKVDAFLARARRAERRISPEIRTAARISGATVVGFDHRLKSPDSLKRKVATFVKGGDGYPPENVDQALDEINDSVRYTLQWPDRRYTAGVRTASRLLADWRNTSVRWANTWARKDGYKAVNSAWREPETGHKFEVQMHTPESKAAQLKTHKLYEEQRLPGTSPARKEELRREQGRIFAAVPVPAGATGLTAPGAAPSGPRPAPVPAAAGA